jgi:hypothetical protein
LDVDGLRDWIGRLDWEIGLRDWIGRLDVDGLGDWIEYGVRDWMLMDREIGLNMV